ncbi:MAG: SseB family protein [Pseudomonadota bacterium]
MTETPLDRAYAAMSTSPDDLDARLGFYGMLVDAELFVMLDEDAPHDRLVPRVFPLTEGPVVLAFDREDRLAGFAEGPVAHAALTGRTLVPILSEARLGLGLNLGIEHYEILLPSAAMSWLAGLLAARPEALRDVPETVHPPVSAPEALISALDVKMIGLQGLARMAVLAEVAYPSGRRVLALGFLGAPPGAEEALTRAAGEALIFSGLEAGAMDVAFVADGADLAERLSRVGLTFEIPRPPEPQAAKPPGMDPEAPPRLR